MKISFLGLGIMGGAMAENLLAAGHQLTVWNRTAERCAPLVQRGATQVVTPAAAVAASDICIAMLADPEAARAVYFGDEGVRAAMAPGKAYIDMSTVDPETAEAIGNDVEASGGRFLEAPVSGSKKPAQDGTLVILAAGDRSLYNEAQPLFEVLGKKHLYLGAVGQGATMKLLLNMTMGGMMTLLCEALALGKRCELASADILDVFSAGAVANPMFGLKGPLIAANQHPTNFPLKHMQKDMRLAVALGDAKQQPLHMVASSNELFKQALADGSGELDFSAVARSIGA